MLEYQLEVSEMDKKKPRTPLELKQWAENELGRAIPESIWDDLIERNDVDETLRGLKQNKHSALEYFVGTVRRLLKHYSDGQRSRFHQSKQDEYEGELTEKEIKRAQALAEYHAKFASADRKIRDFRDSILQGDLLSPEKADTFVTSVTTCFADRFDFRSYGIPYKDHKATLIEDETYSERGEFYHKISFSVEPSRTQLEQPITVRFPVEDRLILDWVHEDFSFQQIMYRKHSLLDELITLSDTLAQRIGCYQQVAALFILTGNPPSIRPISVQEDTSRHFGTYSFHKGIITMKIQPWVSAESVLRTYRKLQQHVFGHSNHSMRSERLLELFRFVTQEMTFVRSNSRVWDDIVEKPEWPKLLERWNHSHPDDKYTQLSNFERDYKRAKESILLPPYISLR
jgi:hypothetical protein